MQRVTLILDRSAALRETFGPEANWWVHAFVADLQALVLRVTGSTAYVTSTIQIATEASEGPLLILSGDTPHLPESRVRDAYTLLDSGTDVVIGLCDRGSWYLLGIRHLSVVGTIPLVSEEVRLWLSGLHRHGVRIAYLPLWFRIVLRIRFGHPVSCAPHDARRVCPFNPTPPRRWCPRTRMGGMTS